MGTPEALLPLTAGNQRPSLAPGGSPSGEPRQQAGLLKFPLPQLKAVKVFVHPDGGELSRGGGGVGAERLFHKTLEQLPVSILERAASQSSLPEFLRHTEVRVPRASLPGWSCFSHKESKCSCGRGRACGWAALWATGSLLYTWSCPS